MTRNSQNIYLPGLTSPDSFPLVLMSACQ